MCASARVSTGRAVGTISLRVMGSYDSAPLRSSKKEEPSSIDHARYCYASRSIGKVIKVGRGIEQKIVKALPEEKRAGLFLGRLPKPLLALAMLPAKEPVET